MIKILILILSSIAILLCLLQEDRSEGILSLTVKTATKKTVKTEVEKLLTISTVIVVVCLFVCMFIEML